MTIVNDLPGGTLYNYQVQALESFERFQGHALCSDEMGLGKTCTALAWVHYQPEIRPVLIVCPATIKLQWARQINQWLNIPLDQIEILSGIKREAPTKEFVIINYDILSQRLMDLYEYGFQQIILDECHYIKEAKAKRSKMVKLLCDGPTVQSVLGLTGTPVLNRPRELWHQAYCINRNIFPNFFSFGMRYCDPKRVDTTWNATKKKRNQSWDFTGASNLEDLDKILREQLMIRRQKSEVLDELPPMATVTVPFEVNLGSYQKARRAVHARLQEKRDELRLERSQINDMNENDREEALAGRAEVNSTQRLYGYLIQEITRLKKEAALAKLKLAIDWIVDFVQSGETLVVFCHHHDLSDGLVEGLRAKGIEVPESLDGRIDGYKRQEYVDRFGDGNYQVLVCGLKAMGQGVDGLQTRSSHLAFLEFGWSPSDHAQAAARLHRAGQRDSVTAYYLLAVNTLDEQLATLLDCKSTVTSASIGEMDTAGIMESLIDAIAEEG